MYEKQLKDKEKRKETIEREKERIEKQKEYNSKLSKGYENRVLNFITDVKIKFKFR